MGSAGRFHSTRRTTRADSGSYLGDPSPGLSDTRDWPGGVSLALNISPVHLKDPLLPIHLLMVLEEEGFPPSRLEIEITETALVDNVESARAILAVIRSCGIKISLDDFGTGYSSLTHLREFRLDKVKIDRSFVNAMCRDAVCEKIVNAILNLARSLGVSTIAEGIESPAVRQKLADGHCDYGQGYYFGRPVPGEIAGDMLTEIGLAADSKYISAA